MSRADFSQISPRPRRLRPQPSRPALAGRRARRRPVRGQLRGRRRAQHPAWRRRLGSVSLRRARRAALAGAAAHERGVDVRIRLACGLLAAVAPVHRAQAAGDRVRRCDRARALSGSGRGDARSRNGRSPATASNGSTTRTCRRRRSAPHMRRRSASIPRRPASVRSAGIPAAARSTRCRLVLDDGGFLYSSDTYADDLPYWVNGPKGPHLIIPYTLDANDMRFINPQGFGSGDDVLHISQGRLRRALCRRRSGRRR